MAASDPLEIAAAIRNACVLAALDGYERAQIAGLCQEGAWECAVDAIRTLDLNSVLPEAAVPEEAKTKQPPPPAPSSA
jgi:hypothetical protein